MNGPTMREARIILPHSDTSDANKKAHNILCTSLLALAGGYTITFVHGAWIDDAGSTHQDASNAYDVAMEPSTDNMVALRRIAIEAARMAGQKTVYVRDCNGQVNILPVAPDENAAEALTGAFAVPPAPKAKRIVKLGEVWKTRDGSYVVVSEAGSYTLADFLAIVIRRPKNARGAYATGSFPIHRDGRVDQTGLITHPLDLMSRVAVLD